MTCQLIQALKRGNECVDKCQERWPNLVLVACWKIAELNGIHWPFSLFPSDRFVGWVAVSLNLIYFNTTIKKSLLYLCCAWEFLQASPLRILTHGLFLICHQVMQWNKQLKKCESVSELQWPVQTLKVQKGVLFSVVTPIRFRKKYTRLENSLTSPNPQNWA